MDRSNFVHKSAAIFASLWLGFSALIACANPLDRPDTPFARWGEAMVQDDYAAAESLIVVSDVARWRADTEQLRQQHRGIKAYQRGDRAPVSGGQEPITVITLIWEDGYTRCMRAQATQDGKLKLLDDKYRDCADIP